MIKQILQLGDPVLRKASESVKHFNQDLICLVDDLADTLTAAKQRFGYGRGIAAPSDRRIEKGRVR